MHDEKGNAMCAILDSHSRVDKDSSVPRFVACRLVDTSGKRDAFVFTVMQLSFLVCITEKMGVPRLSWASVTTSIRGVKSPKAFILISPAVRIANPTTATTKYNNSNNSNNNNNNHHLLRQVGQSATLCLVGRCTSSKVQWDVLLKHVYMEVKDHVFVSIDTINSILRSLIWKVYI